MDTIIFYDYVKKLTVLFMTHLTNYSSIIIKEIIQFLMMF